MAVPVSSNKFLIIEFRRHREQSHLAVPWRKCRYCEPEARQSISLPNQADPWIATLTLSMTSITQGLPDKKDRKFDDASFVGQDRKAPLSRSIINGMLLGQPVILRHVFAIEGDFLSEPSGVKTISDARHKRYPIRAKNAAENGRMI